MKVEFVIEDTDVFPNRKKLVRDKVEAILHEAPLLFEGGSFSYKESIAGFYYQGKRPSLEELAKRRAELRK